MRSSNMELAKALWTNLVRNGENPIAKLLILSVVMINYLLVSYLQNLFVNAFIQPIGLSALIKEVRRLTKTKDILPNEDACSKLVYYKIVHQYNEIWSTKS